MNKHLYPRLAADNMKKNKKLYLPYLLTCAGAVMMTYIMASLIGNPGFAEIQGGGSMVLILILGNGIMNFFLFFFLFYTNGFLMKRRKQEFGVFRVLGLEKKHLARILIYEAVYTACISLGGGLAAGFLLTRVFTLFLYRLMKLTINWNFSFVPEAAVHSVKMFFFVFAVILLYNIWQVYRFKPVEMLRESKAGEKEPSGSVFLTGLGILCLGGGYYLAVTTKQMSLIIFAFFLAVILVIVGTWCLFAVGSVTLLKRLKKNKAYYYQARHFISLSGMIYRLKQNAAGLSIICILSTAVLVLLSSTVTLYVGLDDVMKNRYPRDYIITVHDFSDGAVEMAGEAVEQALEKAGTERRDAVSYRYSGFAAINRGDRFEVAPSDLMDYANLTYLYFLPAEDYNRVTGDNIHLSEDQVMVLCDGNAYSGNQFTIFDRTYEVVSSQKNVPDGFDSMGAADVFQIVVPDMETVRLMDEKQAEIYGDERSKPAYYMAFHIDSKKEKGAEATKLLKSALNTTGYSFSLESAEENRDSFFSLYGGLFFLGIFLGTVFIMAAVLIIYYKQVCEGYEDRKRFVIMQNVGLDGHMIKESIRSQILIMFFLPLLTAAIHISFAFPMIVRLLAVMNLTNVKLFAVCTAGVVLLFACFYGIIYIITSRVYYNIVKR